MSQDFYTCDECGKTMGDYSENIRFCDCGRIYCDDCACEIELHDEQWYEEQNTEEYEVCDCAYCRGEKMTIEQKLESIVKEKELLSCVIEDMGNYIYSKHNVFFKSSADVIDSFTNAQIKKQKEK